MYAANLDTGAVHFYSSGGSAFDLAFDREHNVLYSSLGEWLFTVPLVVCSGPCPPATKVGNFTAPIFAMGYVPGDGLYGVDILMGMLWRIDVNTAALTLVGPTGIGLSVNGLSITDIEFDTATGEMIAAAGGSEDPFGSRLQSGKIYLLDRLKSARNRQYDSDGSGVASIGSPMAASQESILKFVPGVSTIRTSSRSGTLRSGACRGTICSEQPF